MLQIVGISCYLGVFFWMAACIYQEAGKVQSLQYIGDVMIRDVSRVRHCVLGRTHSSFGRREY